ncbi:uncharacterized protein [Argopecten irradians]|uniref:uncharacterized protein n=1 Tax=Argopecten irradians TaxID=31199 RepID=UPI00371E97F4
MVLRKGKHSVRSGNKVCKHCNSTLSRFKDGYMLKFLLNNPSHREDTAVILNHHLSDGDLETSDNYFSHQTLCYSLNKRKRWTLPQQIIDLIDDGGLEEEDYKLVMHERVCYPYPIRLWFHSDTLSYHDTKYSTHHNHGNKSLSCLSDLKLNCHRKEQELESSAKPTSSLKTRQKPNLRGIQRKVKSLPKVKPTKLNIRQVLNGDYHQAAIPEVRYEVSYPRMAHNICEGHRYPSFWYESHNKGKGCCSKSGPQWYYKNFTSSDQRLYQQGYLDDEELFCFEDQEVAIVDKETSQYLYTNPVQITLADFCHTPSPRGRKGQSVSHCRHGNTTPNSATRDTNGTYYGKNKVIYVEREEEGSEEEDEETTNVLGITQPVWEETNFDSDYYHCVIKRDSIERLSQTGNIHYGRCIPPMMMITGETTQESLLLWQKSEFSTFSTEDSEYWVKVHSESDQVNARDVLGSLQKRLSQTDRVYTIEEIIRHTFRTRSTPHQSGVQKRNTGNCTGNLTASLCGSAVELRTVAEAYRTLVSTEDTQTDNQDLVQNDVVPNSYNILSDTSSPLMEWGYCEICLIDAPYTQGCMLKPCGHFFCVDCWRRHIWEKIRQGAIRIRCQTYRCNCEVDDVMVRCLLPTDIALRWIYRKKEMVVERSLKWNWCPEPSCHKVAKLSSPGKRFTPVLCGCGKTWCFSCRSDVHWPASCDQYTAYKKMLLQNGDDGRWKPVEKMTHYVNVKRCPKCVYPMEKNGGCSHMTCIKCSHSFCWECLGDWKLHVSSGMLSCAQHKKEEVTMELDNDINFAFPIQMYKKSVEHRHQWNRIFHAEVVEAKCRSYAIKTMKRKLGNKMMDHDLYTQVRSSLLFLREVHMVLENTLVMLSNATHKSGIRNLVTQVLDRILFSVDRLDQIFDNSRLTENHLRRISRLETSIRRNLKTMAAYVPWIQQQISKSKQAILDQPIDTSSNFS